MSTKKATIAVTILAAACIAMSHASGHPAGQQPTAQAQAPAPRRSPIPDTFTNLQVLPKDIAKQDLVNIMKNFCFTMDKRCSHCHVATDDLSSADFPSDEKETKKKARELLRLILAAKKDASAPPPNAPENR